MTRIEHTFDTLPQGRIVEVGAMGGEWHGISPRIWSGDVDEDEVRAVATLVVEAHDAALPKPARRDRIEPVRSALLGDDRSAVCDACAVLLDMASPVREPPIRDFGVAIEHLRSVLLKEPYLRLQARQLAQSTLLVNMPSTYGLGDY